MIRFPECKLLRRSTDPASLLKLREALTTPKPQKLVSKIETRYSKEEQRSEPHTQRQMHTKEALQAG